MSDGIWYPDIMMHLRSFWNLEDSDHALGVMKVLTKLYCSLLSNRIDYRTFVSNQCLRNSLSFLASLGLPNSTSDITSYYIFRTVCCSTFCTHSNSKVESRLPRGPTVFKTVITMELMGSICQLNWLPNSTRDITSYDIRTVAVHPLSRKYILYT